MTASFAAYASQFLNRQQTLSSSSASQPLFYSFTTDDGSRSGDPSRAHDLDIDDDDDPHLRFSGTSIGLMSRDFVQSASRDEDDPYLRLDDVDEQDEDGQQLSYTHAHGADSIPLIASERGEGSTQGWLAHQVPSSIPRSPPSPPSDTSSDSGVPPTYLLNEGQVPPPPTTRSYAPLTESLLPRDGQSRPIDVFSLPDPRRHSQRRVVHKDSIWTAVWLSSVCACTLGSFIILFTTHLPREKLPIGTSIPYTTLLHTIPLLTILTFLAAIVSYAHIFLLSLFAKPVIFATSVFIPATLFISSIWAFVGSFMWEEGSEPTWSETVGLRLFAIVPLVLAFITARRLPQLREEMHSTSSVLSLAIKLLLANPYLLALSPLILLLTIILSIPFLTLAFRLLLIGYFSDKTSTVWQWHVRNWAGWSIAGTIIAWLWSWGVSRGVLRTTCSGVVGAWYFSTPDAPEVQPLDTHRIHAAMYRATETSLGTVAISALLMTGVRVLATISTLMRKAPVPLLPWLSLPIRVISNVTSSLSELALVYTGLTGDDFFTSARRARALTSVRNSSGGVPRYRRSGADMTLAILMYTPLTLTLPFALTAYLFVAHALNAPGYAPLAALLAGGVTALVGLFCVGLVEDTADSLFMCYCIDRDAGEVHQEAVFDIFEYNRPRQTTPDEHDDNTGVGLALPQSNPVSPRTLRAQHSPPTRTFVAPSESIALQQSVHDTKRKSLDSDNENEESTMLGLDFV